MRSKATNFLITGAGGMLGQAVMKELKEKGEAFVGLIHQELDVTDKARVLELFSSQKPNLVIHLAAWTDVDGCEREPEKAFTINEKGTENIALACAKNKARMIYLSTDFVFDGKKKSPYTEDDPPHPLNAYGRSKLGGEKKVRENLKSYGIIRSSWLFGPGRDNFVTKILSLAKASVSLRLVEDQVGTPTYSGDLARALIRLITTAPQGIYHIANSGSASRYEWARAILEYSGYKEVEVIPIKYKDFSELAPRPSYSVLRSNRLALGLPHWRSALKSYIDEFTRA